MKISVITVCYNSARTIRATLESVSAQRHRDFEHIVVDGGSTDGTLELLRDWRGHPLQLLSGPDRGMYDAMNKGIAAATGDVVGFLNSDDRYADDQALVSIADALSDRAVDCCHGNLVFVDASSRRMLRYWKGTEFRPRQFKLGWMPAHPTLYVRRSLFTAAGAFSLAYRVAADVEWMMRLFSRAGLRCACIPRVLIEMDAGGVSNAGSHAFLRANREVWRACRTLRIAPAPFVLGKIMRKLPQWLHARRVGRIAVRPFQ